MKQCNQCYAVKPLDRFPMTTIKGVSTRRGMCRDCKRAQDRDYAARHKAERKTTSTNYRLNNAERVAAYHKVYAREHPVDPAIISERNRRAYQKRKQAKATDNISEGLGTFHS